MKSARIKSALVASLSVVAFVVAGCSEDNEGEIKKIVGKAPPAGISADKPKSQREQYDQQQKINPYAKGYPGAR
jgi:hypothetical protein